MAAKKGDTALILMSALVGAAAGAAVVSVYYVVQKPKPALPATGTA